MTTIIPDTPVSPLRQKLIDDMNMRHFSVAMQRNYIRDVGRSATFVRRSLDTATTEDVRQFQLAHRASMLSSRSAQAALSCRGRGGSTAFAAPVFVSATLEVRKAKVGSTYKAILRIPHGCGTEEGFYNIKPRPRQVDTRDRHRALRR